MTSIVEVASHWPSQVSVESRSEALGISEVELRRYRRAFGLDRICYDEQESEQESLLAAAGKLSVLASSEDRVRYVLRARTVRAASPYPVSPLQDVRRSLGLTHAQTFSLIDQACAGGLLAVHTAGMLLEAEGDPQAMALVLLGEKALGAVCQIIPRVCVNGEATAAVLVRHGGDADRLLGYAAQVVPIPGSSLVMTRDAYKAFAAIYPDALGAVVHAALDAAGLTTAQVDLVLPHNVNRLVWARLASALQLPIEKIFLDNIPETGHGFTADPFVNYVSARERGLLQPGMRYLMTSVGLGATFAAMVFQH